MLHHTVVPMHFEQVQSDVHSNKKQLQNTRSKQNSQDKTIKPYTKLTKTQHHQKEKKHNLLKIKTIQTTNFLPISLKNNHKRHHHQPKPTPPKTPPFKPSHAAAAAPRSGLGAVSAASSGATAALSAGRSRWLRPRRCTAWAAQKAVASVRREVRRKGSKVIKW